MKRIFIADISEVEYAGDDHNTYSGKLYLDQVTNMFHFITTAGVTFVDQYLSYNIDYMSTQTPRDNDVAAEILNYVGEIDPDGTPLIRDIWMARVGKIDSTKHMYVPKYKERWFRLGATIKLNDEEFDALTTGKSSDATYLLIELLKEGRVTIDGDCYAPSGDGGEPESPEFTIGSVNITISKVNV